MIHLQQPTVVVEKEIIHALPDKFSNMFGGR